MKKVFAFALLVVFGIFILAGCLFLFILPQSLAEVGLRSPPDANPLAHDLPIIFMALAFACLAIAYGGSYLLVRYRVNGYLSKVLGYSKIVALGFILQIVACIPFLLALLGGLKGSTVAKVTVIMLLLGPFVIRQVHLKMQPDRTFDSFLIEDDIQVKK